MRSDTMPPDGLQLADSIRDLASRARRNLRRPFAFDEGRELLGVIARLETGVSDRPSKELALWLKSLRRRLESRERSHD